MLHTHVNYLVNYLVWPPSGTTPSKAYSLADLAMKKPIRSSLVVKQFLNAL